MRERVNHLSCLDTAQSANDPEYTRWADARLDRWLVDWALRHGNEKTARKIAQERGIEVPNDWNFPFAAHSAHFDDLSGRLWSTSISSWIFGG